MAKDVLVEIGMEEIPARFVRGAIEQLDSKLRKWLADTRLEHGDVKCFATPRRIAVRISNVAEKQADLEEEVKGPSRKIALDEQGAWTKAALGFARSQGVSPDDFYFKELSGTEYIYVQKKSAGIETSEVLAAALSEIIQSLQFPKNMRWGANDLRFVRPIRWLVVMFGQDVIPLEIVGVQSSAVTRGHRFLGQNITLSDPAKYETALQEQYVIADIEVRKQAILDQLKQLGETKGWQIAINEDLLEEVLFLVEYPTVLYGAFEPEYLEIPQEVLITSMREHQRYFPVMDQAGKLQPYFVTVRNGDDQSLEQVARGNEKVLRARLADARFFYQEDQKIKIDWALAKLEKVVFQEELGTIGDKVRRIRSNAEQLVHLLHIDAATGKKMDRAAAICKFDLVTQMVYEFPELQGLMGEDYARRAGEDEQVARAVFEHYQPRHSGDASPASLIGAIVSIADKVDTIVGCYSIGIIPTGSQDPYALRRQAAGIVQIILDHQLKITLSDLFEIALQSLEATGKLKRDKQDILKDLHEFFALRIKNSLSDFARYDVVDAVLAGGVEDIQAAIRKGHALMDALQRDSFKGEVDSFNRVNNLAEKATSVPVDPFLFIEDVEHKLYEAFQAVSAQYRDLLESKKEKEALECLAQLSKPITAFFDQVMVMVDDTAVRNNRLALLAGIAKEFKQFADFQKLVWA